jgi:hypothetical protein
MMKSAKAPFLASQTQGQEVAEGHQHVASNVAGVEDTAGESAFPGLAINCVVYGCFLAVKW